MEQIKSEWNEWKEHKLTDHKHLQSMNASHNVADYFEYLADKYTILPAIVSVELPSQGLSYTQLDQMSNKLANWALNLKLKQHEVVALMMENRPEFPAFTVGMSKVGVTTALINFNLTGNLLAHAINVSKAKHLVVTKQYLNALSTIDIEAMENVNRNENIHVFEGGICLDEFPETRPSPSHRSHISERDPYVYIYTSGTTGPSKAAIFSHRRWIGCGLTWSRPSNLSKGDSYYIPLPLYHGNGGAVALSAIFLTGGRAVLRQKFSVSNFWSDIDTFQCKTMIYVGELWRYISNTPKVTAEEGSHYLKTIVGNGLRNDIWTIVCERFGIDRVVEHYGSTEMPGDAVIQWFGKVGSCGFVPWDKMKEYGGVVIKFDIENCKPMKQLETEGWGMVCGPNEPGELIMPLPDGKYDGYVNKEQTEKKLYSNYGRHFENRSRRFLFFVDRTGDTFRWKGENVATTDVQEILSKFPNVSEVNVYGVSVPGYDGKAGMAAIHFSVDDDDHARMKAFSAFVQQHLAHFSRPVFVRIKRKEMQKTSTIKLQKHHLALEGFNMERFDEKDDALFILLKHQYTRVDEDILELLNKGQLRI